MIKQWINKFQNLSSNISFKSKIIHGTDCVGIILFTVVLIWISLMSSLRLIAAWQWRSRATINSLAIRCFWLCSRDAHHTCRWFNGWGFLPVGGLLWSFWIRVIIIFFGLRKNILQTQGELDFVFLFDLLLGFFRLYLLCHWLFNRNLFLGFFSLILFQYFLAGSHDRFL